MSDELLRGVEDTEQEFTAAVAMQRRFAKNSLTLEDESFIKWVTEQFKDLKGRVQKGVFTSEDSVKTEAAQLANRRAYIMPAEEMSREADSALQEMKEWGVPAIAMVRLERLQTSVSAAASGASQMPTAQAALFEILEAYYYWDWYGGWWSRSLGNAMKWLCVIFLFSLMGAVVSMNSLAAPLGVSLFGALAGACVSVALKPPSLSAYGDAINILVRSGARIVGGVASGIIGYGVLASGFLQS